MRYADQLHIGKHHAWALFAIIKNHLHTLLLQRAVKLLCIRLHRFRFLHIHRHNRYLERGDLRRPDNPAIIVVLFNRCRDHTADTNSVTTHSHHLRTAIFTLHRSIHRLRIFCTQLENMSDFNATFNLQRAFSARTWVTFDHVTQISNLC